MHTPRPIRVLAFKSRQCALGQFYTSPSILFPHFPLSVCLTFVFHFSCFAFTPQRASQFYLTLLLSLHLFFLFCLTGAKNRLTLSLGFCQPRSLS